MAKGPAYTDDEQKLLNELAKKGGSPTLLAAEFAEKIPGRSAPALVQKIRKLILDREGARAAKKAARASAPGIVASSAPKRRGRPPKVNTAPLSDAPPAPAKRRGRPPKALAASSAPKPLELSGNGSNGNGNGHSEITVDLHGLKLVGSKKRVVEALQQLS